MNTMEMMELGLRWLWRASWQASVVVLLVLVAQWIFRSRLAPRWRGALWWLVLVRLTLPATPESAWSVFNLTPLDRLARAEQAAPFDKLIGRWGGLPEWPQKSAKTRHNPPAVRVQVTDLSVNLRDWPVSTTAPNEALVSLPAIAARPVPEMVSPQIRSRQEWRFPVLGWIWMLGVVVYTGWLFLGCYVFRRKLRARWPLTDARILGVFEQCRLETGTARAPEIWVTSAVDSPALFGMLRCRLLIPPKMVLDFSPGEWRHVFLHELAHVRRRDVQVNWLMAGLQALHWFNPLVWFAFGRMRADRELACDAAALARCRGEDVPAYGKTIVKLLEGLGKSAVRPGLVGILEDKKLIEHRIRMIAGFKTSRRWPLLAVLLMTALCVFAMTDARTGSPSDPATKPQRVAPAQATNITATVWWQKDEEPDTLHLRIFKVDLNRILKDSEKEMPMSGTNVHDRVRRFITTATGINFDGDTVVSKTGSDTHVTGGAGIGKNFDAGNSKIATRAMVCDERTGTLIVRATQAELKQVEQAIEVLHLAATPNTVKTPYTARPVGESGVKPTAVAFQVSASGTEPSTAAFRVSSNTSADPQRQGAESTQGANTAEPKITQPGFGGSGSGSGGMESVSAAAVGTNGAVAWLSESNSIVRTNRIKSALGVRRIQEKLSRIVLDRYPARATDTAIPLFQVFKELAELSRQQDPEHQGVDFAFSVAGPFTISVRPEMPDGRLVETAKISVPGATDLFSQIKVQIRPVMRNVRLEEAIQAIVSGAEAPSLPNFRGLTWKVEDYAVVVSPKVVDSEALHTKAFKVDPNTFIRNLEKEMPARFESQSQNSVDATGTNRQTAILTIQDHVRRFFSTATGINFNGNTAVPKTDVNATVAGEPGAGKNSNAGSREITIRPMFFNDRTGVLFVRATVAELDLVEQAVMALNKAPAQINVQAKLVMIEAGSAGVQLSTVDGLASPIDVTVAATNILSESQYRSMQRIFAQWKGTQILTPPTVTTLSGRPLYLALSEGEEGFHVDILPEYSEDSLEIRMKIDFAFTPKTGKGLAAVSPIHRFFNVVVRDGKTVVYGGLSFEEPGGQPQPAGKKPTFALCITPTIIDPAGNRVHADNE